MAVVSVLLKIDPSVGGLVPTRAIQTLDDECSDPTVELWTRKLLACHVARPHAVTVVVDEKQNDGVSLWRVAQRR